MLSPNAEKNNSLLARLDTVTDFFNRMVSSVYPHAFYMLQETISFVPRACHAKCIAPRYAEGDLNKGESVCIDRCVAKFNDVQKKVGEKLQNRGAAAGGASAFGTL